jgi:hypothetical protein
MKKYLLYGFAFIVTSPVAVEAQLDELTDDEQDLTEWHFMVGSSDAKLFGQYNIKGDAQRLRKAGLPRGYVGLSLDIADPLGELGTFFDSAIGGQIHAGLGMAAEGRLRLRGDFGFLIYGREERELCAPVPIGCRINLGLDTNNSILFGGIGPEFVLMTGQLEPYVYGTMGFSYFVTTSSLRGSDSTEDAGFMTTNYSDGVMAWKAGGGFRIRLIGGEHPISMDLGLERHQNGIASFLTKGDIQDNSDGSITRFPNRSEANLMTFRFGLSGGW